MQTGSGEQACSPRVDQIPEEEIPTGRKVRRSEQVNTPTHQTNQADRERPEKGREGGCLKLAALEGR